MHIYMTSFHLYCVFYCIILQKDAKSYHTRGVGRLQVSILGREATSIVFYNTVFRNFPMITSLILHSSACLLGYGHF